RHEEHAPKSIDELLSRLDEVPEEIRTAVRNAGGGHSNHSLFWPMMKKDGGGEPAGTVAEEIKKKFGEFSAFKEQFSTAAAGVFGSGWAWLALSEVEGLVIVTTPNQDSPISNGQKPLLGLDVWEHAYYLKYQNRRAEYIENWWQVVNWEEVGRLFSSS
ncbi:MAG: superoxide dismutase, partial [Patescibacteria group bacterium]